MEAATEASANGPDPASSRGPAPNGPARERPDREGPGPERPDEAEAAAGIVVSATELGQYADWRFCPRCAWVRRQVKQLPFQGFPGIFSTIDRYNKLIVRNHFERESRPPDWLSSLGEIQEHISPPHWSSFKAEDANSGVTLRGEADAIFRMSDGSYAIIDYKTSRYNPDQRGILQAYRAQLNAYAYIGERVGFSPVSGLALVYMEPATGKETAEDPALVDPQGFSMGFRARVVPVDLAPETVVPPLLRQAARIHGMDAPPPGRKKCRDCEATEQLLGVLRSTP